MASRLDRLIDQFEPALRDAFMAAVDEINSRADLSRMVTAIERGDIEDAIAALHLEPEAYAALLDKLSDGFKTGGMNTMANLPALRTDAGKMVIRFDARNLRAEDWLKAYSSDLVTAIVADQRDAIRSALKAGMAAGQNPRAVALDIVGRYSASLKKREGGIIGLTSVQESYARSAQAELLSGDRKLLRNYLDRGRRDKRFDAAVIKAITNNEPLSEAQAARMVQRYRDRLLQLRGETIGRTEAMTALHSGQEEGLRQVEDTGVVPRGSVGGIWRATGDSRTRHTHAAMHGQYQPVGQAFLSPSGARLRYPGDPDAPAAERIQCRCWREPKIDFLKGLQ